MDRPIKRLWNSYRELVVPADAPDVQLRETRQAFYAGAAALLTAVNECLLDPGDEPTAADLERMAKIQNELDEFGQQLDSRYLRSARDH
jgi:hypothetical protein